VWKCRYSRDSFAFGNACMTRTRCCIFGRHLTAVFVSRCGDGRVRAIKRCKFSLFSNDEAPKPKLFHRRRSSMPRPRGYHLVAFFGTEVLVAATKCRSLCDLLCRLTVCRMWCSRRSPSTSEQSSRSRLPFVPFVALFLTGATSPKHNSTNSYDSWMCEYLLLPLQMIARAPVLYGQVC